MEIVIVLLMANAVGFAIACGAWKLAFEWSDPWLQRMDVRLRGKLEPILDAYHAHLEEKTRLNHEHRMEVDHGAIAE